MANTIAELLINIKANTAQLESALNRSESKVKSLSQTVSKANFGSLDNDLKTIAKTAAGVALGMGGLSIGVTAVKTALEGTLAAAADDAASQARLRAAVLASGAAYSTYEKQLDNVIKKGQELGFTDNDTRGSIALLVAQTDSVAEAMKRYAIAQDLARGANIDITTASRLLGKITEENVTALQRYGITINKDATETEALAAVQAKFAGQAKAFGDSAAGSFARFSDSISEAGEAIGRLLLPAVTDIADHLTVAAKATEDFLNETEAVRGGVIVLTATVTDLGGATVDLAVDLQDLLDAVNLLTPAVLAAAAAFAIFFPGAALIAGVTALAVEMEILKGNTDEASSATLQFEKAWFKAEIGILQVLSDIETAILNGILAPLNAVGSVLDKISGGHIGFSIDAGDLGDNIFDKSIGIVQKRVDDINQKLEFQRQRDEGEGGLGRRSDLSVAPEETKKAQPVVVRPTVTGGLPSTAGGQVAPIQAEQQASKAAERLTQVLQAASDGMIDLGESITLGLSDGEVVALELAQAQNKVADAQFRQRIELQELAALFPGLNEQQIRFAIALQKIAENLQETGRTAEQFNLEERLRPALEKLASDFNALFNRPTRETAGLNLRRDELERKRLLLLREGKASDDPLVKSLDAQINAIQQEIDIRQKDIDIMRDKNVLADKTLLTDAALAQQAALLTAALAITSSQVQTTSGVVFLQLTNLGNAANETADALRGIGVTHRAIGGPAGGLTAINEKGPELIRLPTGSYVFPAAETRGMLGSGTMTYNITTYITADSKASRESMQDLAQMVEDRVSSRLRLAGFASGAVNQNSFTPAGLR